MIVPPDPAPQFDAGSVSEKSSLRVLLQPRLLVLFALIFLGNGYFNAIFTWLEPMLGANGIDAEHAGLIALAMLIGGVAGMAAVPAWPALRTHLRWTIPIAALLGVPLSLLLTHGSHAGALYVVGIVLGVLMLAPQIGREHV